MQLKKRIMMKIYLISSIVLLCNAFLAQNDKQERDTVFLSQIYLDESTYLVSQKVIDFDSISASELLIRFENWGGQTFRNYEKVRTSKTETQITLNYITSTFNTALDFYLIMVVEFKDNKIRVQIFDDGNVYKPGSYSGSTYIPGIAARIYHLKSYFSDGMIIYKPKPGMLNVNEKHASGSLYYKRTLDDTFNEIETFIKSKIEVKKDDDGW
jgi:hypothetical protein